MQAEQSWWSRVYLASKSSYRALAQDVLLAGPRVLRRGVRQDTASNKTLFSGGGKQVNSAVFSVSRRALKSIVSAFALAIGLIGCTNDVVPTSAVLTVTPATHEISITERQNEAGQCLFDASRYVDIPILMQLNTADGSPIGDITLNVYADFAANTYSGIAAFSLYDDLNSNGVVDPDTEFVSAVNDDIAQVKTGKWTGSRSLLLRINLSCSFLGSVFIYTGGTSARAAIEVIADSVIKPEPVSFFIPGNDVGAWI